MENKEAVAACLVALDGALFKALAEPARIDILRVLILHGRQDVGSVAAQVPQDRSVVARHLRTLELAGLLRASSEGRHTFYEIDGAGVVRQLESLLALFRQLAPSCCP
ncbi:helix-turn-helix transcriptional regulator [Chitinimonas sp. BJYL2]|uniref:ArsR/SmtB family transcription factor n=1 Tax=Chitinimonas sp. BJYL2 TaxID=2976696 RepID=UPI0022B3F72F|nr:helix-turn-helix transcriptional regulator [Chitinimonas sp. BJYL2]